MRSLLPYLLLLAGACSGQRADSISAVTGNEDSSLVAVERLSVNSAQSDYGPVVKHGKLYFVSARNNKVGVQYTDVKNSPEITDLYVAQQRKDGKVSRAQALHDLNTKYYEGPLTFSPGGDTIYFTGNDRQNRKLKVFSAQKTEGKWSNASLLPFCADTFSYCHPALSPDGKTLYVSSNKNTGGDMDIFVSTSDNGTWTEPVKLAGAVNGPSNEIFPFVTDNRKLYFASDRPGGLGGLDLYYTFADDSLRQPQLLYPPLNSQADDFGIWVDSTGNEGYISSNRLPQRGDDIYRFSRSIPDFSDSEVPPVQNRFCYTFYEEEAMKENDSSIISYRWVFGDGQSAEGVRTRHCYDKPGIYQVHLHVLNKKTNRTDSNAVQYEVNIGDPPQLRIEVRDTAAAGDTLVFDSKGSSLSQHEITARYWSFGDGFYNRGETVVHRYRKPGRYVAELWVMARSRKSGRQAKFRMGRIITVKE